jgi:lipopolysaccharide transport system permease protein
LPDVTAMLQKLKELFKYRQLIATLVTREVKARYRGTALGFLWSLFNPMLLMIVYSIVFGYIFHGSGARDFTAKPIWYSLFLLNGLLPWIWFASSLLECSNVLVVHGALIKKNKFPLEVLPIMVVTTNMIHFLFAIPVLVVSFIILGKPLTLWVLFLPVSMLVQYVFTLGIGFLISALAVHFRDIRDILSNLITLWFFATPVIYLYETVPLKLQKVLDINPMTHLMESYHYAFFKGSLPHYKRLGVTVVVGVLFFYLGYVIFDKLRDTFVEEV